MTKTTQPRSRKKASSGSVTAKNSNGRVQLVFRHPQTRKQIYVSVGLPFNAINVQGAIATTGSEIQKSIAFGTIDAWLQNWKERHNKAHQNDRGAKFEPITLTNLWQRYVSHKREVGHRGKPISESTIKRDYGKVGKRLEQLPSKLNYPHSAKEIKTYFRDSLELSEETLRRSLVQFNACCRWGVESGLIETNEFASLPKPAKRTNGRSEDYRAFSDAERALILEAFENNTYCSPYAVTKHSFYLPFVKLAFMLGTRPEELVTLTWQDVGADFSEIRINKARPCDTKILGKTKTGRSRKIPCNKQLRSFLKALRPETASPSDLLVTSPKGTYLDYHNFGARAWKTVITGLVSDAKVQEYLPLYNMRHTVINAALKAGVAVADVAYFVGNSPETIMRHYVSRTDSAQMPEI